MKHSNLYFGLVLPYGGWQSLIRHLWQLKTVVFLHWCLICTVPLGRLRSCPTLWLQIRARDKDSSLFCAREHQSQRNKFYNVCTCSDWTTLWPFVMRFKISWTGSGSKSGQSWSQYFKHFFFVADEEAKEANAFVAGTPLHWAQCFKTYYVRNLRIFVVS